MIDGVIQWLRRLSRRPDARAFTRLVFVPELHDVPDHLAEDAIYVAGSKAFPKWAVFRCPCREGHVVTLSLQPTHRDRWRIKGGRGGPSIQPSVDVHGVRRCHYWIRNGLVSWVPDHW